MKQLVSRGRAMAMLQQRVNAVTGRCEWVVVTSDSDDDNAENGVNRALIDTAYLDMLNDAPRNRAFHRAIAKAVSSSSCRHAMDIGAGTGLLSMMVCRAINGKRAAEGNEGSNEVTVTACESYLPMYKLALKVLRQNGMESSISLHHMRSDEMRVGAEMRSRADLLVSEILDSELLGEGIIPTLRHAHEHLLKPNACTVPYRATVYGQIVESDFLRRCHDLKGAEHGLDGLVLSSPSYPESSYFKSCQYALHVDALFDKLKLLSEPFEAFSLDFFRPPDSERFFEHSVSMLADGTAQAVVSWWVLQLDKEGLIQYSTAPKWLRRCSDSGKSWSDHWRQCVWFIPGRGIDVRRNSRLQVMVSHDETAVRYEVEGAANKFLPAPVLKMGPNRVRMLGDHKRRSTMKAALEKLLWSKNTTCLVLDDSLLATLCAASGSQGAQLYAVFPALKAEGISYVRSVTGAEVSLIQKELGQLTVEDFAGRKVDVVVGEPYYYNYEDMLPWNQLRFWHEKSLLQPILSAKYQMVPCGAVLRGMAYSLPDLWNSHRCLGKIEGFDHSPANKVLGACSEGPTLAFSLWQCGCYEALSEPFSLMSFDLSKPIQQSVTVSAKITFTRPGTCHGIVLWMDWVLDTEGELLLSTGPSSDEPSCWKQGIRLLETPVKASEHKTVQFGANFSTQSGEISFQLLSSTP